MIVCMNRRNKPLYSIYRIFNAVTCKSKREKHTFADKLQHDPLWQEGRSATCLKPLSEMPTPKGFPYIDYFRCMGEYYSQLLNSFFLDEALFTKEPYEHGCRYIGVGKQTKTCVRTK